jgi:hypothetical protein
MHNSRYNSIIFVWAALCVEGGNQIIQSCLNFRDLRPYCICHILEQHFHTKPFAYRYLFNNK